MKAKVFLRTRMSSSCLPPHNKHTSIRSSFPCSPGEKFSHQNVLHFKTASVNPQHLSFQIVFHQEVAFGSDK